MSIDELAPKGVEYWFVDGLPVASPNPDQDESILESIKRCKRKAAFDFAGFIAEIQKELDDLSPDKLKKLLERHSTPPDDGFDEWWAEKWGGPLDSSGMVTVPFLEDAARSAWSESAKRNSEGEDF